MVKSTKLNINLFLIGFSGSGKSTVGPALAKKMKLPFFDTDKMIEAKKKKLISLIFEQDGENKFREYEQAVITKLVDRKQKGMVVALGGGTFTNHKNRILIHDSGISAYLKCNLTELTNRLIKKNDRPLLSNISSKHQLSKIISSMMGQRRKYYEMADLHVSTSSNSTRKTVEIILKKISEQYANS